MIRIDRTRQRGGADVFFREDGLPDKMSNAKWNRREFLRFLTANVGAEAVSRYAFGSSLELKSSSREVIEAAAYGVSSDASPEENSRALLTIRARMQSSDSGFDLLLPDGRLDILTGRWLQGVANVHVRGGKSTQLRNVGVAKSTTECVPLIINQDYFLNNAGSVPGFGEFTNGDRIQSVAAGASRVRLLNSGTGRRYRPGMPILVYGYNQDSQGYPPSIRYFERNVVAKVDDDVVELGAPLRYAYDARWADIEQNADEARYMDRDSKVTGAARILSMDRPGFRVAKHIVLDDLEFLPSRDQRGDEVNSLGGSLYAFSADTIVCNRVRVNGYFYPSASGRIIVNDSYIRYVENDKLVDSIEYNRCRIGFFSNGPAVNRIVVNDSTIEEPIPILSCRAAEFNNVTFLGERRPASALVTLSFSTPMESIVFNRPKLVSSQSGVLPLTTGGGVVRVKVAGVSDGVLYANFTGVNDPIPRGLSVGSVLRNEDGRPQFDVTGIWLENGQTAIGVNARHAGATGHVNQVLVANICKRLSVFEPVIVGHQPNIETRFSSPRSSSNSSFDVSVQLNADDTRILDAHHSDGMITGGLDFDDSVGQQRPFDLTIHQRARQLVVSVSDKGATPGADRDATLVLTGMDYAGRTVWRSSIDMTASGTRTIGENQVSAAAHDRLMPLPSARIVRLRAICSRSRSTVAKHVDIKILLTNEVSRSD
ncbi:hypothetical protein ACRS8P_34420 [Burkholderia cenocepacia]